MEANFPKLEEEILKRWEKEKAFEKSLERRKKAPRFVFYEGPPTANGRPGMHHVLARSFKDVVCRYKTMRGFYVGRKAGWDTHGLPVELEAEKKLGLKSKKEIEQYGIAKFNKECKKSVWEYKQEWENLTERIGFWLDMDNPYITYSTPYLESLWYVIAQFWKKGLLYKDYKVVPYCPRCGTPESSHELAQGYRTVTEKSVFAKFQISNLKSQANPKLQIPKNTYILAWTTTPWTLPGNVALAVGENVRYAFVEQNNEIYVLAKKLLGVLEGEYKVVKEVLGKDLEGVAYEPLFGSLNSQQEKKYYVALADFVSTEDGTGVVHTAVMYGEDDYRLGTKLGLPKKHTVDEEGKFNELVPQWKGVFVKEAEPAIVEDLKKRNLLYKEELYEHEYPFCWRCSTPLLYYAKDSWFVNMQKVKKQLIANNQSVNWIPPHTKNGRMGEWLAEVKDWAFSRERYWGTPLPVWECDTCGEREVIGSLGELKEATHSETSYSLLRHGHSERQITEANASWPEKKPAPLTKKGKAQVAKVAKQLHGKVDIIVSSDLLRAKETAETIARELGVGIVYDKRLREFDTGIYNGKSVDEMTRAVWRKQGETPLEHFLSRFHVRVPGGENYVDVQKRMLKLVRDVEKKYGGKRILLVSHELPLTLLEGLMNGFSREETVRFRMKNAIDTGELRQIAYAKLPFNEEMEVDLHRPYVDAVEFACKKCQRTGRRQGTMKRVKDVADVWFDSGAMPFAQGHWPFAKNPKSEIRNPKLPREYPADYIVEAIDQTRGWFYTLLAVATALGFKAPYKNVISMGHILDEKGEKMSKSRGNIVNPWDMIEKYGVDTLRWYFYTLNHPWDSKAFAEGDVRQTMRKFILTLWNSFAFYKTYACKTKTQESKFKTATQNANILDRWIVSRLNGRMKNMAEELDRYDITGAARNLERFVVEDLSLWYIRRSRQRFQSPASKKELQEASDTLYYALLETSKLLAPFAPFLAEYMYRELGGKGSVHWEDFPKANAKMINKKVEDGMERVLEIVSKGLAQRAKAGIKIRQPLVSLKASSAKYRLSKELLDLVKDEVNVKEIVLSKSLKNEVELDTTITPELKQEGMVREIVRNIQEMRKKAGYKPQDRARVWYSGSGSIAGVLRKSKKDVAFATGLKDIAEGRAEGLDMEQEFFLEGEKLWLGIKRY